MLRFDRVFHYGCTAGDGAARLRCSIADCRQCMLDFAVATPEANEAVMNACVAIASINAEASIAVATSVIMEHIGALWKSDPSSPASAAGAAVCQTASNMVPSACDALVRAGFSVAAAHAACYASDPDCYLKLLIAFAADDSCVTIMTEQHRFMQCLSGTQCFMQCFSGPMFAMLITKAHARFRPRPASLHPHVREDTFAADRRHIWS